MKAIFAEDETPANWKNYIELNKQFFKDNPGVKPATKASPTRTSVCLTRDPFAGPSFLPRRGGTVASGLHTVRCTGARGAREFAGFARRGAWHRPCDDARA